MSGYMSLLKSRLFLTVAVTLALTQATPWSGQAAEPTEAENQQEEFQPDGELLEFLGLFDDPDSGWVDPMYLLENDVDDIQGENEKEEYDESK